MIFGPSKKKLKGSGKEGVYLSPDPRKVEIRCLVKIA